MMSVIRARNAIHGVNEMAVVFGSMDKPHADAFIAGLNQRAVVSGLETPMARAYRPKSPAELALLAGSSTRIMVG